MNIYNIFTRDNWNLIIMAPLHYHFPAFTHLLYLPTSLEHRRRTKGTPKEDQRNISPSLCSLIRSTQVLPKYQAAPKRLYGLA